MSKMDNPINTDQMYSIGEVAKICNVSRKTLRYYEQLGLVTPDHVCLENGYRYYTEKTMNLIPVIKYYKQMGFKLQEMSNVQSASDFFYHETNFLTKASELKREEQRIRNSYTAISDWIDMLREGTMAIENQLQNVNVKYLDRETYVFMEQDFSYDCMNAVINIPWVNYLEEQDCEITGPVILYFENCQERMAEKPCKMTVMQKPVSMPNTEMPTTSLGGKMFLSSYHLGDPDNIYQQYQKIQEWAKEHGYVCSDELYERYVIDYWATTNVDAFVVELLVPTEKIKN